jgi:hypothetical protein
VARALAAIEPVCAMIKIFGSFPRYPIERLSQPATAAGLR